MVSDWTTEQDKYKKHNQFQLIIWQLVVIRALQLFGGYFSGVLQANHTSKELLLTEHV